MKTDIHPKNYRPVVFQDTNNGKMFLTQSCVHTKETVKYEDGKEYPVFKTEISSASHPFYTGKKMTVDSAGRIEKFKAQREAAEQKQENEAEKNKKVRKRNTFEDKVNIELQKQVDADQKKEDQLMAKIRKNRPKTEEVNEVTETTEEDAV